MSGDDSFAFVQALATELSSGKVELPGFPDVAARVQQVLADENVGTDGSSRCSARSPCSPAQLLSIANSVALNPTGRLITDLRKAVARVGLNTVRTATIAYAVRQLRAGSEVKRSRPSSNALWKRNVLVASMCYVLARTAHAGESRHGACSPGCCRAWGGSTS